MNIILLGPPGAGKGTLAERLVDKKGFVHISTGQILREAVANETEVGLEAKSYMDKGELVPDEVVTKIVVEKLKEKEVKEKGFMLDGFPRTIKQAELLDDALSKEGLKIDIVIFLDASEETIIKRLSGRRTCEKCGRNYNIYTMPPKVKGVCDVCGGKLYQRDDDKEETVRNRLKVYKENTAPLVKYYENKNLLKSFKGDKQVDEILNDILSVL